MDDAAKTSGSVPTIVVSAADSGYFGLLRDLVVTLRRVAPDLPMAVLDLGLRGDQRSWLEARHAVCLRPRLHCDLDQSYDRPLVLGTLAKAFLYEYLPGYELYVWLDADTWVQRGEVLTDLTSAALAKGMAVVHEHDPAYRFQAWLSAWNWKHAAHAYGLPSAIRQRWHRQINTGVFCIRKGAQQWQPWQRCFEHAILRTRRVYPNDQFALNQAIYCDGVEVALLGTENNWICDRATPAWDRQRRLFVTPSAPHRPISVLHLAGPAKSSTRTVAVVGGGALQTWLTWSGSPAARQGAQGKEDHAHGGAAIAAE